MGDENKNIAQDSDIELRMISITLATELGVALVNNQSSCDLIELSKLIHTYIIGGNAETFTGCGQADI